MQKRIVCLFAALVLVLGLAAVSSAAPWGQIWYGGYVNVITPTTIDPETGAFVFGTVTADTGIFVFNPNPWPAIVVKMIVFDKKGTRLWSGYLFDGLLEGDPQPKARISPYGWGWITLGMVPNLPQGPPATKYTFVLNFYSGPANPKAPVIEIKEVLYTTAVSPIDIFTPDVISDWSETSLGGSSGTGFFPVP